MEKNMSGKKAAKRVQKKTKKQQGVSVQCKRKKNAQVARKSPTENRS